MDEDNKEQSPHQKEEKEKGLLTREIEDEMKQSYLDYAMSVIVGRALPDVRDGLKPVHRRILYAMSELSLSHNKPFKKSARIVGEVLGKYHPHGDSAVYDALVRLAQTFSLRYPLVDGQGNFGSVDGDSAAAMRYTEARMRKAAEEMLEDIEKETVEFVPNFDDSLKEPRVLPSKIPNLLINGSTGIAVGMATNIPPHNISEIGAGIIRLIDEPDIEPLDLIENIPGPDFPTGGQIIGTSGIKMAYKTGHGKVKIRATYRIEETHSRERIIITEIPYMVNKSMMIEQMAELVRDKKIIGISNIRDESDKEGIRVVIDLKKDANAEIVVNQLLKHSRMQVTFGINMLGLVDNEPRVLNIKELLSQFIIHRKDVITKRTEFDLRKAEARSHIVDGLLIALEHIDEIIALIKKSKEASEARNGLTTRYSLSEKQANAILEMRLQRLTGMEQDKLKKEHEDLLSLIEDLRSILSDEQKIKEIIKKETKDIIEKYGDERRTAIQDIDEGDIDIEDLIEEEYQVITVTHLGYVKRQPIDSYKKQNRGGKGIIGTETRDEDFVEKIFVANTHSYILCFTESGQVHWIKVYQIPEGSRISKGKPIVNLIEKGNGEKITAMLAVRRFDDDKYLILATEKGIIKKTKLGAYAKPRRGGIRAIILDEEDRLIGAKITDGKKQIMLATGKGSAIKFHEKDARPIGRTAKGVIGIRLRKDDKVIAMVIGEDDKTLLTITENGFGKRTPIKDYTRINRGGLGVINIKVNERNGKVVAVRSVEDEDEMMFISRKGIIIRIPVRTVSTIGRNTMGVRIMKPKDADVVVSAAKVLQEDKEISKEEQEAKEETPVIERREEDIERKEKELQKEENADVSSEEHNV